MSLSTEKKDVFFKVVICIITVLLLTTAISTGVTTTRDLFFESIRPVHCNSDTVIMEKYCTNPIYLRHCFSTVAGVEGILRAGDKTAIFAHLQSLEPQRTPPIFWAVEHATEAENSHLDTTVSGTADYFNNNAYFYNVEQNQRSVKCNGGWNFGFWKTRPDSTTNTTTESIQLQYCEEEYGIRVCGAFDIQTI